MTKHLPWQWFQAFSINAINRLEAFLLAAITTVFVVRVYLRVTGYPQVGGGELHIAHLLWGGLLLLVGLVLMLSYLSHRVTTFAAVISGIGFGLFIDEIGKFVTKDNDYFFRPALSLIFTIFVLLFYAIKMLQRRQRLTPTVALANTLDLIQDAVVHGWSTSEKALALRLLRQSDPGHPLVASLTTAVIQMPVAPPRATRAKRVAIRGRAAYRHLRQTQVLRRVAVAICALKIFTAIVCIGTVSFNLVINPPRDGVSFFDLVTLVGSLLVMVPLISGVRLVRHGRRLAALVLFKKIAFVSFFLVTLLSFYWNQFNGVIDLGFNLAVLAALQFMIDQERQPGPTKTLTRRPSLPHRHPQLS